MRNLISKTASGRAKIRNVEAKLRALTTALSKDTYIECTAQIRNGAAGGNLKAHVNSKTRASRFGRHALAKKNFLRAFDVNFALDVSSSTSRFSSARARNGYRCATG